MLDPWEPSTVPGTRGAAPGGHHVESGQTARDSQGRLGALEGGLGWEGKEEKTFPSRHRG